ncbi:MAG: exosortase/archaeosortase family protein [Bacteroidota bacterium]
MKQIVTNIADRIDKFFIERRMYGMKDILTFLFLTLLIHFGWRFWENKLGLFPIHNFMTTIMNWLANEVLYQSTWALNTFMGYKVTITGNLMEFPSGYDISINSSCSGMKQIMQFVLLMLIYRGPWLKKLWFIPLGALLVHITNLFRIFLSGVLSMNHPEWMKFAHDNVLRWMFYLVICGLWLFWVKRISVRPVK